MIRELTILVLAVGGIWLWYDNSAKRGQIETLTAERDDARAKLVTPVPVVHAAPAAAPGAPPQSWLQQRAKGKTALDGGPVPTR